MQVAPEINYKDVEKTQALDTLIHKQIARLERVSNRVVRIHVTVEQEQGRHQEGNPYRVRLDIRVPPNHELVVSRQSVLHVDAKPQAKEEPGEEAEKHASVTSRKDEPLPAVVRRTFDSARRQLEKLVERQRGEMKQHPQNEVTAYVEKLLRDEGYGFLRAIDGDQVYFHRNSTLHGEWERLSVGTGVRYTMELGEKGLQASSVEIVDKPGSFEQHKELHELPVLAVPKSARENREKPNNRT
jgi:cold shock CspA family protein/ribosome-associated translation inhibitor RaiA